MDQQFEQLEEQLRASNQETVYDALIDVGKEGLYQFKKTVEQFLHVPDPELRGAAIRVLAFYWQLEEYQVVAEKMFLEDSDEEVRSIALMGWANYFSNTNNPTVLSRLYCILHNHQEASSVRSQSYRSIFVVVGLPKNLWPKKIAAFDDIDAEVEWDLVSKLVSLDRQ
jgi:HEAT repeat protein